MLLEIEKLIPAKQRRLRRLGQHGDVGQQLPVIHGASSFAEGHTVILGGDPSELLPLAPEQQGVLPGETGAATTVGEGVHGYG
jgi:hypothetical protein